MLSHEKLMDVIRIQTDIGTFGLDLDSVMNLVVERTLSLIDAEGAAVELVEGNEMVYRSAAGTARSQIGLRLLRSGSLSGLCVETGRALRCDDSETDPRTDREACRRVGLRSMIVIPLKHQGVPIGVLKAMSAVAGKFSDADVTLLELLSGLVSSSMYFSAKYSSDQLFKLATHDGLTGLANRSHFLDRLRNAMDLALRQKRSIAILVADMDGLKEHNDRYGHKTGDALLQEIARRLKASVRSTDLVARLGGDEFALILTPVELPYDVQATVRRIESLLSPPCTLDGQTHALHVSMGVAAFPADASDMSELLHIADQRMYTIKRAKQGVRPGETSGRSPSAAT